MFKRKRSTKSWSVRAIEFMLVMVAAFITASILFPQPETVEIRVIEAEPQVQVVTTTNTASDALINASYEAALDYMRAEDYFKSVGLLEAITNEADHYWAHVSYSFVLYEMGQYDHAISVASEGIRINPDDAVAWNNRCLLQALIGNLSDGLNDCDQSIAINSAYDYSHNNRCYILAEMGEYQDALQSCYQALENNHRMPEWVYTNLGRIALKQGLDRSAADMFITALDYNPEHAEAYAGLGNIMLVQANYTEALEFYELYKIYAGVHYDTRYDVKVSYIQETMARAGQN